MSITFSTRHNYVREWYKKCLNVQTRKILSGSPELGHLMSFASGLTNNPEWPTGTRSFAGFVQNDG